MDALAPMWAVIGGLIGFVIGRFWIPITEGFKTARKEWRKLDESRRKLPFQS